MKKFDINLSQNPDQLLAKKDVYSTIWRQVFFRANELGASDIHVEPFRHTVRIRVRVNGELMVIQEIDDLDLFDLLIVRLKEIARLDISYRNDIQDSAFELEATNSRYRAALAPSGYGESIVFRIIRNEAIPKLADCQLTEQAEKDLRYALSQKKGFICITGPTGSGKSTTLQACIGELDRKRLKVITLEDPKERDIPDVIQQEISPKLTWAKGIKIAMRQDPDVILIGEIRDPESAQLAFQAAQTGHLVLSTLHTNDVAGTLQRLTGLGVSTQLLADNLLYCSAQRLNPLLCTKCRVKLAAYRFVRGKGCGSCNNSGVIGRVPVLEYSLNPDPNSIIYFDKKEFQNNQLQQTRELEIIRLARSGAIDYTTLF